MKTKTEKKLPWWRVTRSVLASFFGVQSRAQAIEDFEHGNFKVYAIIGIVAVIIFILTVWSVVKWVLM